MQSKVRAHPRTTCRKYMVINYVHNIIWAHAIFYDNMIILYDIILYGSQNWIHPSHRYSHLISVLVAIKSICFIIDHRIKGKQTSIKTSYRDHKTEFYGSRIECTQGVGITIWLVFCFIVYHRKMGDHRKREDRMQKNKQTINPFDNK